jgi:hypothetical protein
MTQPETDAVPVLQKKMSASFLDKVASHLYQEEEHEQDRFEIPEAARVIITPESVEIYTFDDFMYLVEFKERVFRRFKMEETGMVEDDNPVWKKAAKSLNIEELLNQKINESKNQYTKV